AGSRKAQPRTQGASHHADQRTQPADVAPCARMAADAWEPGARDRPLCAVFSRLSAGRRLAVLRIMHGVVTDKHPDASVHPPPTGGHGARRFTPDGLVCASPLSGRSATAPSLRSCHAAPSPSRPPETQRSRTFEADLSLRFVDDPTVYTHPANAALGRNPFLHFCGKGM